MKHQRITFVPKKIDATQTTLFDERHNGRVVVTRSRFTCLACGLGFNQEYHHAGLCTLCREDLDRTYEFAVARLEHAFERFDEAVAKETPADQKRYDHVQQDIIKAISDEQHWHRVQRGIQRAREREDGLARILQAKARCDITADDVQKIYDAIEIARQDLDIAIPVEALPEALQTSLLDQAKSKAIAILNDPRRPAEAARREVMHVPEKDKQAFRDWVEHEILLRSTQCQTND